MDKLRNTFLFILIIFGCSCGTTTTKQNDVYALCGKYSFMNFEVIQRASRIIETGTKYFIFVDLYTDVSDEHYAVHLLVFDKNLRLLGASKMPTPSPKSVLRADKDTLIGFWFEERNRHRPEIGFIYDLPSSVNLISAPPPQNFSGFGTENWAILDSVRYLPNNDLVKMSFNLSPELLDCNSLLINKSLSGSGRCGYISLPLSQVLFSKNNKTVFFLENKTKMIEMESSDSNAVIQLKRDI